MEKTDLILLLLYAKGQSGNEGEPIRGITRLVKLLFLLGREENVDDAFTFEPYKMGPFSSEVYAELEYLKNFPTPDKSVIAITPSGEDGSQFNPEQIKYLDDIADSQETPPNLQEINAEYSLTIMGQKLARKLWEDKPQDVREKIEGIKKRFSHLPLRQLLRYVYDRYPDMTVNSEIKDQVYGR